MDRDSLINKFGAIEGLAHRGKDLIEIMDHGKIVLVLNNIRRDLQDLEMEFGRRTDDTFGPEEADHKA